MAEPKRQVNDTTKKPGKPIMGKVVKGGIAGALLEPTADAISRTASEGVERTRLRGEKAHKGLVNTIDKVLPGDQSNWLDPDSDNFVNFMLGRGIKHTLGMGGNLVDSVKDTYRLGDIGTPVDQPPATTEPETTPVVETPGQENRRLRGSQYSNLLSPEMISALGAPDAAPAAPRASQAPRGEPNFRPIRGGLMAGLMNIARGSAANQAYNNQNDYLQELDAIDIAKQKDPVEQLQERLTALSSLQGLETNDIANEVALSGAQNDSQAAQLEAIETMLGIQKSQQDLRKGEQDMVNTGVEQQNLAEEEAREAFEAYKEDPNPITRARALDAATLRPESGEGELGELMALEEINDRSGANSGFLGRRLRRLLPDNWGGFTSSDTEWALDNVTNPIGMLLTLGGQGRLDPLRASDVQAPFIDENGTITINNKHRGEITDFSPDVQKALRAMDNRARLREARMKAAQQ